MAGQYIASIYDEMEQQVINDIARRVQETGRFTETAEIMARTLREQGYSPAQIQAEVQKTLNADNKYMAWVAQNTRDYKQEVKKIIKETVDEAKRTGNTLVAQAGEMSWNDDMQLWAEHGVDLKKDNTLTQLQKAFTEQTMGQLINITRTTGALSINGVPVLNAYRHELDLATIKVASGAFSFQQAVKDATKNMAKSGLKVTYPSGRRYNIDTAARMAVKTGLSQLSGKITEANLDKTGTRLVFVQAHAGARPEHAEWQGKVYTYKGKPSRKYPDFIESTGYGTVTGLKGVNCSHEFYPWWEGDEIPEFKEPDPKKIDGKNYTFYEAIQKQRQMERQIRELKREKEAAEAIGDNAAADELQKRIKQKAKDYKDFSWKADLRPKTERLGIVKPGNNTPPKTGAKIKPDPQKPKTKKPDAQAVNMDERVPFDKTVDFKAPFMGYSLKTQNAINKAALEVAKLGDKKPYYEYGILVDVESGELSEPFTSESEEFVFIPKKLREKQKGKKYSLVHNHLTATEVSSGDADAVIGHADMDSIIAVVGNGTITAIRNPEKKYYNSYSGEFAEFIESVDKDKLTDAEFDYIIRDELLKRAGIKGVIK